MRAPTLVCMAVAAFATSARADVADFYRGRTITLVVSSGAGGMYDFGARLMAQHLKKYIPGNPSIVVQNMAGASGVVATEYLFNVGARDGTMLGDIQSSVVLAKVLNPAARYTPAEFNWLGRLRRNETVGVVWKTAPATTVADATKQEIIFAANGATGYTGMLPWALNRVAGTKIKVITGYTNEATEWLAVERGEAHGIGSVSLSDDKARAWVIDGTVKLLYTNGTERHELAPYAPTLIETARNDADRSALRLLASSSDIGETLVTPPGVPPDRIAALREAFEKMARDPALVAEAMQRHADVAFLHGSEVQKIVAAASRPDAATVEHAKMLTAPQ